MKPWQGPYKIATISAQGLCELDDAQGKRLKQKQNVANLKEWIEGIEMDKLSQIDDSGAAEAFIWIHKNKDTLKKPIHGPLSVCVSNKFREDCIS